MPLSHFWFVVRASQGTDHGKSSVVAGAGEQVGPQSSDSPPRPDNATKAVSSSDAASSSSHLDSFVTRYSSTLNNLEATANFWSEKVKRIFRVNFGTSDPDNAESPTDDAPPLIKTPVANSEVPKARGPYDATLDEELYQSIMEEATRRHEESTPKERLRAVFRKSPLTGEYSPEARFFYDRTVTSFVAGMYIGYFRGKREARRKFLKLNLATKYTSPMAANRKRMDFLVFTGIQNGIAYAVPLTGFMMVMTGVGVALAVVDGEEKAWHMVAGAAFAGMNNRILLGPRAMFVGGAVGAVLGVLFAIPAFVLKEAAGVATLKQLRHHRHVQEVMEELYEKRALPAPPKQFELYNADPYLAK